MSDSIRSCPEIEDVPERPRSRARGSALCVALTLFATAISAQRVAFTTSTTGSGALGSWPGSGGESGVAAGDSICRSRAAAAGLPNPQGYYAWLSDSNDDAYCRIHGLTGTRAANCGQASLPEAAGPWVRTDGLPFAGSIAELTGDRVVYHPLLLDEFGAEVAFGPAAAPYTGTLPSGALFPGDTSCADWTSASDQELTRAGDPFKTSSGWSTAGTRSCDGPGRLICLEGGAGVPLPSPAIGLRRAFLTSVSGPADLGSWPEADPGSSGLAAGDSICRNLAQTAGFTEAGTFRAWLSDDTVQAPERFDHDGPWATPNRVVFAYGLADLTDGVLRSTIHVTEEGEYFGNVGTWTGTGDDGVRLADRCQEWTSASPADSGTTGRSDRTRLGWSGAPGVVGCDASYLRLYCLSDAEGPFFADGFEWGTTTAWSLVAP